MNTVVITGAAGTIGSALRPLLAAEGRTLRLMDVVESDTPAGPGEEWTTADLADTDVLERVFRGADLVVHLGGIPNEKSWKDIDEVNITDTRNVLEAAHQAGVTRVLLASSIHAVGFATLADAGREAVLLPRPDTYYGVSKAAMEALGSLYVDRYGMSIVSARIANFGERPSGALGLYTWLAPSDMARLVEAAGALSEPGHHIVWGISNNTRRTASAEAGHAIGFHPQEDAEQFAAETDESEEPVDDPETTRMGGSFTRHDLGTPM
jgi:nucleoside-diphosphate-sugar epimerase